MYQTPLGEYKNARLYGKSAIKMQHQVDHLDGLLLSFVGLPITDEYNAYTEEEQDEILKGYLESLDMSYKEVQKEIEEDEELKQLSDGIKFMEDVAKGNTKVTVKQILKSSVKADN